MVLLPASVNEGLQKPPRRDSAKNVFKLGNLGPWDGQTALNWLRYIGPVNRKRMLQCWIACGKSRNGKSPHKTRSQDVIQAELALNSIKCRFGDFVGACTAPSLEDGIQRLEVVDSMVRIDL